MILALLLLAQYTPSGAPHAVTAASAGTFTLSHTSPTSVGCAGSTTCSVTLSASMASGSLATVQCYTTNAVAIQSTSAGGTLVPVYSTGSGVANSLLSTSGYIFPTSSTAGPMVFTFTGSIGAGSTCVVREYTVSSGTPTLDTAHATTKAGTTSVTGETLATLSGSNDLLVQSNNTDYQLTTAVSTYGNGKFDATNGPGWSDRANTTSTTAPTWTITSGSGNAATNGMAFATDATVCKDELYIDFEGGTNTAAPTTTNLNSSSHGMPITGTHNLYTVGTVTAFSFATAASMGALHTPIRLCGDGTTYSAAGSLGLKYDINVGSGTNQTFTREWVGSQAKASFGFFWQTSRGVDVAHQLDVLTIQNTPLSGAAMGIVYQSGKIRLECYGGSTGLTDITTSAITTNTTYWITAQIDTASGCQGAVYETATWTQVGTTVSLGTGGWTPNPPNFLKIGRYGGDTDNSAQTMYYDSIRVSPAGTFPLLP